MSEPQINWINISGSGVFHQVRDELLDTIIENAPIPAKITAPKTRCWFSSDSFLSDATLGRPGWLRQTALRELQVLSGYSVVYMVCGTGWQTQTHDDIGVSLSGCCELCNHGTRNDLYFMFPVYGVSNNLPSNTADFSRNDVFVLCESCFSGTHREVTPRKWIEHGDMIRGCPFNTVLNKDVIECFVDTITTPDWWNRKNAPRHFGYWTPCVNSPLPYNK